MDLSRLFLNPISFLGDDKVWMASADDAATFTSYRHNIDTCLANSGIPECSEHLGIALYRIGKTRDEAKTVVVVSCANERKRKLTKACLKSCHLFQKGGALAKFKIRGKATPPETASEPLPTMQAHDEPNELSNTSSDSSKELIVYTQPSRHTSGEQQPGVFLSRDRSVTGNDYLGSRILARQQPEQGTSISQSATAGPLILVDGQSYQLTVQHVADFDYAQSSCHIADDWDDDDSEESEGACSSDEELASWNSPTSLTGSGGIPYKDMSEALFSGSPPGDSSSRDIKLDALGHLDQQPQPQPLGPGPTASTSELSRPLGCYDATTQRSSSSLQSSGLDKQYLLYGSPDIDYILVPTDVDMERVSGNAEIVQECDHFNVYELKEARSVIIATALLGYVRGVIFPAPMFSRRPWSPSFQILFCVQSEKTIPKGASGSAIFDVETGFLAGYIVLGCPADSIWYMTPISTVLDDLRERLGVHASCQIQLNVGSLHQGSHNLEKPTERSTSYGARLETCQDTNGEMAGLPSPPILMVKESAAQVTTKPVKEFFKYTGNGIVPISDTINDLGRLLRTYCVTDGVDDRFWTEKLLRHILTTRRIKDELKKPEYKLASSQVDEYVNKIHPSLKASSSTAYIKVFALLVLVGRVHDIEHFINEQVNDQVLPIEIRDEYVHPLSHPKRRLRCFDTWKINEQEYFEHSQWMVNTPYFHSTQDQPLTELTLHRRTRKPWRLVSGNGSEVSDGAYGTVVQVEIHPTSHSFQQVLRGINLDCATFAIKTLHSIPANTEQVFMNELEMLKRFSGHNHPHLVTALSAFNQDGKSSFIFPYAPSNFGNYIETINPPQGWSGAIWASAQLFGLIGAIDTIHNPKHLHIGHEKKYGRHGDIKCNNVLCFRKSGTRDEVTLVLSDFGLAAYDSDKSRSNIPNRNVPPVPGYRPPECDIEGGTISRAFDIWTIGCLFLELVTWFLGGPQYVEEFRLRRTTKYINGASNDIFFTFDLLESEAKDGTRAIQVKPEVTAWIHQLRRHPLCSQFLHEVLNIIEQEMLVVLSTEKNRSSSEDLRGAFFDISEKCKSEENYTLGKPWSDMQLQVALQDMASTRVVRAVPSSNARALLSLYGTTMSVYRQQLSLSLSKDNYKSTVVGEFVHSFQRASYRLR